MWDSLFAFVGASLLVSMAPGPTTVVIMRQSIHSGRRAGISTVLGNEAGWLTWTVTAALGLSVLLLASRLAYDVLRFSGAVVLIYLGAKALWQARREPHTQSDTRGSEVADRGSGNAARRRAEFSRWRTFRMGLITNLANPKAGVFAVSFLPQFVPDGAPVLPTLLLLAVMSTLIDLAWYLGIVSLVSRARGFFQRPSIRRRLGYISGAVLIALGIRLATEA